MYLKPLQHDIKSMYFQGAASINQNKKKTWNYFYPSYLIILEATAYVKSWSILLIQYVVEAGHDFTT